MKKVLTNQFILIFGGFLLLIHAFQAFEHRQENISIIFMVLTFIIFVVAGCLKWLSRNIRKADAIFFVLQALALYFSAYLYKYDGRIHMIVITLIAATLYLGYGFKLLRRKKQRFKKTRRVADV